ncbi:hypothetical protein [Paraburkholderia kururiensis]|uniref:Uncharacterized protein n=1 Tax=Paraburkholderia kururiensis TaxID=984307 RepID=A0ABZ0WM55_9BURK|nr:hypothetical protein [Paraburkholderia kururiensis]WQD78378.1 hypothetical protein U0042_01270 [Paraburkholderia kururiensis]
MNTWTTSKVVQDFVRIPTGSGLRANQHGERIGPSALSDRDKVFADWTANFDGLRYPFEKYEDDTAGEYEERGSTWLSEGGSLEDATFRFHSEQLFGMLYALRIEAQERLRKLPQ